MRQRRDTGTSLASTGERPVVRADQVFVWPVGPLDERCRHPVLARPDGNRLRLGAVADPVVEAAHSRVCVVKNEGDPLAVDRDVDVIEPRVVSAAEREPEDVFAVCRKDMVDHHSAPRPVRGALDVVPRVLREVLRVGECLIDGGGVPITDRHPADRRSRVQVGL